MSDIAFRTAGELAAAIRSKEIGSRELLDHYLLRLDRLNPPINAIVSLDAERARAEAHQADERAAHGEWLGPLHGVPMTVKECFEVTGMRTTSGAPELAGYISHRDAVVVARLRAAGAVIFGKTNLPLYARDIQTFNDVFGTTNNPWDLERIPGGSSGGAAAALAAGLTPLEVGTDIGGSIRNPAHYCGVYGHKPTFDIIPRRGAIPGPPGSLAQRDISVPGPMARSADDLDLGMDVLAGPDDDRAVAWRLELPPARHKQLQDYRVAAWLDDPACPVDGAVLERLQAAVAALRDAGVTVDEEARPGFTLAEANRLYLQLLWAVSAMEIDDGAFEHALEAAANAPDDDESLGVLFSRFVTQRKHDWHIAHEQREQMRAQWAEFFRRYDVLLCPAMPVAAYPHDHTGNMITRTFMVNGEPRPTFDGLTWAGVFGMCYLPGTVGPVGRTADGLPVGVQVVGPYLEDRTTIDFTRRLTEIIGGFEAPPGYE